jgi:hypothetical protein
MQIMRAALKLFNVDVFHTVRVTIERIRAVSATDAARIANEADLSQAIAVTGKPATRSLGAGYTESYPVLDATVQEVDCLYYGVYPRDPEDDCDHDGHPLDWNFRPSDPRKGPSSRERDLLIKLMAAIDPQTRTISAKHMGLLTDVARATEDPCPVYVETVSMIEVAGYARFDCPEDLTYEQWVNQKLAERYKGIPVIDDGLSDVPF